VCVFGFVSGDTYKMTPPYNKSSSNESTHSYSSTSTRSSLLTSPRDLGEGSNVFGHSSAHTRHLLTKRGSAAAAAKAYIIP